MPVDGDGRGADPSAHAAESLVSGHDRGGHQPDVGVSGIGGIGFGGTWLTENVPPVLSFG